MTDLGIVVADAISRKCYEPVATTRDRSVREMRCGPHHIRHRFEFKGGITVNDLMRLNLSRPNPLLARLRERGKN
jgi:hypothetical protein